MIPIRLRQRVAPLSMSSLGSVKTMAVALATRPIKAGAGLRLSDLANNWFVTFRLADSLPADVLAQWRDEGAAWLKLHPQPWDWKTAREYMRKFEEEREHWLDQGHGSCLLRGPQAAAIVAESLDHFHQQRYLIDSYVVMPNHVHVLIQPPPDYRLPDIVQAWKSFTAREANRLLGQRGRFWEPDYFDRAIRDERHLSSVVRYIHDNPVRRGYVSDPTHWRYSSARNDAKMESLVSVTTDW